jgi:hypothetical protein
MFSILGKDGKLSVVRIGSLIAAIGVVLILVAVVTFYVDQAARRRPLDVNPPRGAEFLGSRPISATSQEMFYRLSATETTPDDVAAHYNELLSRTANFTSEDLCQRSPKVGNFLDYQVGNGIVPFEYKCIFDNSGFNTIQFTEVTVQPGIFDSDPNKNTEGFVFIRYVQQWSS